jgi:integrase
MESLKLTIAFIKKLSPGKAVRYADTEVSGLQVRISATKVSYYFRKKHNNKVYEILIGHHPNITLEEARTIALEKLAALSNYSDISSVVVRKQPTVKEALDLWLEGIKDKGKAKSIIRCWSSIEKKKIAELRPSEIERIFYSMKETPIAANHSLKSLKAAINKTIKKLKIEHPVPFLFDGINYFPSFPRTRTLQEKEAPEIIENLRKMQNSTLYGDQAKAILLMLSSGQRKSKVLGITAEQIDVEFKIWHVPGNDIKRPVDLSLDDLSWKIIEGQLKIRPTGHLFLWRGKPMKECRKTFSELRKRCGIEDLHIHDLRRSIGTWMLSTGATIEEVSKKLGHSSIRVTEQVYAHLLGSKGRKATNAAIDAMIKGEV